MKIEITRTDGKVYPYYCAGQQDKIELRTLLEDDSTNREQFANAVIKYDSFATKSVQHGFRENSGHIEYIKSFDDLLVELGKFGGV